MKSKLLLLGLATALFVGEARGANETDGLGLVPAPRSVEIVEGKEFVYDFSCALRCDESVGEYAREYLHLMSWGRGREIAILHDPLIDLPAEGYELTITPERVEVRGVDRSGVINGFHTLLQLFPEEIYDGGVKSCELPCVRIVDWPEYPYRGMHFDVARTFSSVELLKEYIGHLAHHKINTLHLHLTDDEGWRVEILSHPELTEVGAWRGGDSPIGPVYGAWDERYGGYYTQEELREVVKYADMRGITIVPEIDLPGHSLAMGKVYPEVLCPVEIDNESAAGYDRRNVLCVSREENYALLDDILREVCDIFPSEYIHIGGDEVSTSYWRDCPHCSALLKEKGFENYSQLQQLFMERVSDILAKYGRKAAVWNEATNGGVLPLDVRVHGWESLELCRKVAEAGYPTVVMPGPYFYFDMRQSDDEDGHNWAGPVTIEKCYSVDLDALGYSDKAKSNVIGFSGAFWTELYLTHGHKYENYAEYQTFPRVCAVAEVSWLPQSMRHADEFFARLEIHKGRMEAMGISYRRGAPEAPAGEVIEPRMKGTTSLPFRRETSPMSLSAYGNAYGHPTTRTCHEGDWVMYEFEEPLESVTVELTTGYRHVPRGLFTAGVVEIKALEGDFVEVAELEGGCATLTITEPIKAIRIRCTKSGNGDSYVYLQHPVIRAQ